MHILKPSDSLKVRKVQNLQIMHFLFTVLNKKLEIKQFWSLEKLYINIREYYGDNLVAPKVDSLNIVSNKKPLSVVSKPENNSNIEVFTKNGTKANIDEIELSNQNNKNQIEEKSDNKKKWLIAGSIALGTVLLGVGSYFLLKKFGPRLAEKSYNYLLKEQSPAKNPKLLEAIQPDNFNRIALLKGLSSEEIAILQKSMRCSDANCFFPTLTGHKPACIIGMGEDLSFLSRIKTKNPLGSKFDFVHLKELGNQTFVLNKEKVLEVISRNKDFYTARLGLSNNSSIDDIYNFMLQYKNQVFNCTQTGKFNDIVGITLGFPKQSSMMFELERLCDLSNLKNIKYTDELRKKPSLYKKIMLETLNKNKELYKNLSVDEYNGLIRAIENYKPIKTKGIADRYYQYVKLANEPTEFARIDKSVEDFVRDFSVEKLF